MDDIDLHQEKVILESDKGFGIITIKKEEADKSKEYNSAWSKVSNQFFSTMSKAQGKKK
jgi:hypothetical protein